MKDNLFDPPPEWKTESDYLGPDLADQILKTLAEGKEVNWVLLLESLKTDKSGKG